MADEKLIHIHRNGNRWEIQKDGEKRPALVEHTRERAITSALYLVASENGSVVIHDRKAGRLQK